MCGFLLRIMLNAVLLFLIFVKVPGFFVDTLGGMMLGAAIIGIANGAVRPLMSWVALPLNGRNLAGATIFTNLLTPAMVVKTLPGFKVYSVLAPGVGMLLMMVCSFTLSKMIQDR